MDVMKAKKVKSDHITKINKIGHVNVTKHETNFVDPLRSARSSSDSM